VATIAGLRPGEPGVTATHSAQEVARFQAATAAMVSSSNQAISWISAPTLATSTSVARNQKMAAASRAESSSRPASDRSPPIRLGFRGLAVAR
jgi:hypothetical protein